MVIAYYTSFIQPKRQLKLLESLESQMEYMNSILRVFAWDVSFVIFLSHLAMSRA